MTQIQLYEKMLWLSSKPGAKVFLCKQYEEATNDHEKLFRLIHTPLFWALKEAVQCHPQFVGTLLITTWFKVDERKGPSYRIEVLEHAIKIEHLTTSKNGR